MKNPMRLFAAPLLAVLASAGSARSQDSLSVKITPLGARTGEYCARDRALLFEDPTGVRILYDPGITVGGGTDSRLGEVHAILVSHNHFDHIGYRKLRQDPDDPKSICDATIINALGTGRTDNTTTAEIAAAKNSAVLVNTNVVGFLNAKISGVRGQPTPACYPDYIESSGPNEMVVPRSSPCTAALAFGTLRIVTRVAGTPGVRINMVAAHHNDGIHNPMFLLADPLGGYYASSGITAYGGLAVGYVLTFTNGLKVYLTGDTGPTSDMATIVRDFYHANLAVANVDGVNSMGPEEAAYAMKQLVQPLAVIISHAEEAVTTNGQVNPNTRTAQFMQLVGDMPVYVPLSGKTMEFDGSANCVRGCTGTGGAAADSHR